MLSTFGLSSFKERRIHKFSPILLTMFTYSINDRSTTTRTPKYNVIHLACQTIQRAQNCLQNLLDILNHFFCYDRNDPIGFTDTRTCMPAERNMHWTGLYKQESFKEIIWVSRLYFLHETLSFISCFLMSSEQPTTNCWPIRTSSTSLNVHL